jgi:hypothetical protein
MNYSEYLRRKLESLPVVMGPSRYGDESTRIMVARYKSSGVVGARRGPGATPPPSRACCGPTPYWRSGGGRPDNGPWPREGDGQQQEWSRNGLTAAAARCAICPTGLAGYVIKPCCPQESTVEIPRDATGHPTDPTKKPAAYKGRETCCPARGPPLYELEPKCCDKSGPGRIRTLLANDMPVAEIPVVPAEPPRCCAPCANPCGTCTCC